MQIEPYCPNPLKLPWVDLPPSLNLVQMPMTDGSYEPSESGKSGSQFYSHGSAMARDLEIILRAQMTIWGYHLGFSNTSSPSRVGSSTHYFFMDRGTVQVLLAAQASLYPPGIRGTQLTPGLARQVGGGQVLSLEHPPRKRSLLGQQPALAVPCPGWTDPKDLSLSRGLALRMF